MAHLAVVASALALLLSAPGLAQEERSIGHFAGVGVRAMGMGGAFTGVADDFTAIYWNPAGLAQIRDNQVYTAMQRGARTSDALFAGTAASAELVNTRFTGLGIVLPYPVYRGSLVFAAGTTRIQDFDWNLRQQGPDAAAQLLSDFRFEHQGGISLSALAAAMDVSPTLSLGVTLGLTHGVDESTSEYTWMDTEDLFIEHRWLARESFRDEYSMRLHTVLGAMLRSPRNAPRFRLGATMALGATREIRYTFRGLSDVYGYNTVQYDDGTVLQNVVIEADGSVTYTTVEDYSDDYQLSLPLEFSLGGSYAPVPGILLAASAHFAEWEQASYQGHDEHGLRGGQAFRTQYRNTMRYHLGAEWQVPVIALDLRAGYYTDPLPFVGPRDPDLDVDASNPLIDIVQDRSFLTVGAGMLLDRALQIDLAWTHGNFRQVEGDLTEEHTVSRLVGSLGYRF
jgi:long-subunit fatty acid transport protein